MFGLKKETKEPSFSVMGESDHYIVYSSDFHGPEDVLKIAEELRSTGVRVLSFGRNGGILCEKMDAFATNT